MSYANQVIFNHPSRFYRLDDAMKTNGSSVLDLGSQAQNGTVVGNGLSAAGSMLIGDSDGATSFGSSSYISLPTTGLPTGAGAWSVECLTKYTTLPPTGNFETIFAFGTANTNELVALYAHGSHFHVESWTNDICNGVSLDTIIYHLVVTYDGTTVRLYANGSLVASAAFAFNIVAGFFQVGNDNTTDYFNGSIYGVSFYNVALSQAQITADYQASITAPQSTIIRPTDGLLIYEEYRPSNGLSGYGPRLAQMAAGGFKLVMNYDSLNGHIADVQGYINAAASNGMKSILNLGDPVLYNGSDFSVNYPELAADSGCVHTNGACLVDYVISNTKSLAGLWGYYMGDEVAPANHSILKTHADNVKLQDSTHPRLYIAGGTSGNSCWQNTTTFQDCCDVIGDDFYPVGNPSANAVGWNEAFTGIVAGGIQLFAANNGLSSAIALQAHDLGDLGQPDFPTMAQMLDMLSQAERNMTARIILWYSFWLVNTVPPAPATQWTSLVQALRGGAGARGGNHRSFAQTR